MLDSPSAPSALERLTLLFRSADRLDHLMSEALDVLLETFECDRAWLLYPCDPSALSWRVPMERTREGWPGALEQGVEIPMSDDVAGVFRLALETEGPVSFAPSSPHTVPQEIAEQFHIRSQLILALRPAVGQAWLLGLHACQAATEWSDDQVALFAEIGGPLGQVLATLLALEAQRDREARLRNVLDMTQETIAVVDERGRILDSNANATRLFELPSAGLLGQEILALGPGTQPSGQASREAGRQHVERAAHEGLLVFEWLFRTASGVERLCEVRLARIPGADPLLLRASITDISKRREIETRLRHRERVESVGRLVGGIVHDFNNLLTVISSATELIAMDLSGAGAVAVGADIPEHLDLIRESSKRAGELTQQLLAYASKQIVEPRAVDMNEVVETSRLMLCHVLTDAVELRLKLAPDLCRVLVDPGQVVQILVNLVANARDALPPGGHVEVSTFNVMLDEHYCREHPELQPGRYGVLVVTDKGEGMTKDVLAEIFEPFFTTKPKGQGTGLGLATVYGIVRQHHGLVTVDSEPGRGSSFSVYLPQTEG